MAKDKKDLKKMKGKDKDKEEGEEEYEDGMEKKCDSKKSEDLTGDDLSKSLDLLDEFVSDNDEGVSRKDALLQKALDGELPEDEKKELFGLMGDAPAAPETPLKDEVAKSMDGNETVQNALEVSDFLREQNEALSKALGVLAEHIEKSDATQGGFNLLLSKAVSQIGRNVEAMSVRLGVIETQPAHGPKSKGVQPINKSFAGRPGGEDGADLNKSQIMGAMTELCEKSYDANQDGMVGGVNMKNEVIKFEVSNKISRPAMKAVQAHIAAGAQS